MGTVLVCMCVCVCVHVYAHARTTCVPMRIYKCMCRHACMCVCVCVCMRETERERERESKREMYHTPEQGLCVIIDCTVQEIGQLHTYTHTQVHQVTSSLWDCEGTLLD